MSQFETEQAQFLPVAVPDLSITHAQHAGVLTFDPRAFPKTFVKDLVPADNAGLTVYPITLYEDAATRERVILNADGNPIAVVSAPPAYNPRWYVEARYPDLYSAGRLPASRAWLLALYDPARIAISFDLIRTEDYPRYAEQQAAAAAEQRESLPMDLDWEGGSVTDLLFTAIQSTNGIALTLAYPAGFTNRLDLFRCSDLVPFWWDVALTTNSDATTNHIHWLDAAATNAAVTQRFYAAGNADCSTNTTDPDNDALTWAREKYLYHTSPTNADTDADGFTDYEEVITYGTDPNNNDTSRPTVQIVFPAAGAYAVWFP